MYNEERIIDGVLCWRGTPDSEFKPYTAEQLTNKLVRTVEIFHQQMRDLPAMLQEQAL